MPAIPTLRHVSNFPSQWVAVLEAAMQAFDAKLGEIKGGTPWTGGLKGAAIIREYPDRAWIASVQELLSVSTCSRTCPDTFLLKHDFG